MNAKFILIGWSGADWELARPLIEAGKMPNLARLVACGSSGETNGFPPYSSPMIWATIATGQHPDKHGLIGYATTDEHGVQVTGSGTRRVKALWNILSECGKSVAVVGWPCTYPAERVRGQFVSDAFALSSVHPYHECPAIEGCVHPRSLAGDLAEMRLRPQEVDTGLLGLFIPELHEKGIQFDPHLLFLKGRLAELYSLHNAAVLLMAKKQPDFFAVHFSFIRQISEQFLLYRAPRHPRVNRGDHARFYDAVNSAYRLQDALLGDLLQYAAQDSTAFVLSDHGFLTGDKNRGPIMSLPDSNPALLGAYRLEGIFAAKGPNVARRRLGTLRLDDVAPTVLTCFQQPQALEMRGRVIEELFQNCSGIHPHQAHENFAAECTQPPLPATLSQGDTERIARILVERHLLPQQAFKDDSGSVWVERQNEIMLGTALQALGRPLDALAHLQKVTLDEPESLSAAQPLVHALLDLRMLDDAERAAQLIFDYGSDRSNALRLRALLLMARGFCEDALRLLHRASELRLSGSAPESNRNLQLLILAYSNRQREAASVFQAEIKKNPHRALLYLGLGNAFMRIGRQNDAIAVLEKAIELDGSLELAKHLLWQTRLCLSQGRRSPSPSWNDMAENVMTILERERDYRDRERQILSRRQSKRTGGLCADNSSPDQNGIGIGEDTWVVRPPWPDEEVRLKKYFNVDVSAGACGQVWKGIIHARKPERIVGVAALRETKFHNFPAINFNEGLLLEWEIRDGWLDKPAAESLLRLAMDQIKHKGEIPLVTCATSTGMKELAQRLGFEKVMRREIGVMSSRRQFAVFQNRFGERLKAHPIQVWPINKASTVQLRAICERHSLLSPRFVQPVPPGGHTGFDSELSFLVGCPENPAIILLAREHLGEVYLEILARNPDVPDVPRLGIIALLMRFWETVGWKGLDKTFYQITAGMKAGLGPIIHRFSGHATQFWEILLWKGLPQPAQPAQPEKNNIPVSLT